MRESIIQKQVIEEIKRIPENNLPELYNLLHAFRLGLQSPMESSEQIIKFAGCWNDMPDEVFDDFMEEITQRRELAFSRRRRN